MRLRPALLAALVAASSFPVAAGIAPGGQASGINSFYAGNGELFMIAFDATAKISYAFDMGVDMNAFFTTGQQDAGYQRFWPVNDANWTNFLAQVDRSRLEWMVTAFDTFGSTTAAGGYRLYSTVQQGQECQLIDCTQITPGALTGFSTWVNGKWLQGIGTSQSSRFFNNINSTGTHGVAGQPVSYSQNGTSVNAASDGNLTYVGRDNQGLSSTYNGSAPFDAANPVGKSSWFYYLTRSGPDQNGFLIVDEFDNLSADGYFGFTYVDPSVDPTSPYVGQYLLSYTIAGTGLTAAQLSFARQIGRTETSLGGSVVKLPGGATATAGESPSAIATVRLGGLTTPVSVVPEPGSAWMLAAGGLLLLARRRARR